MESRVETLLNALINGETIDFTPQSRMEEYLKNCINKSGVEDLPAPQSRVDALLYKLAEAIASGGGDDILREKISKLISGTVTEITADDLATVHTIKKHAFSNKLISIDWGDKTYNINMDAFSNCSALQYIHISSIEQWCQQIFNYESSHPTTSVPAAINQTGLYINGNLVTEVVIPETITNIQQYSFKKFKDITSIQLHDKITSIGTQAFAITGIKNITIPKSVTKCGSSAFMSCSSLTSAIIENGAALSGSMFSSCSALTEVNVGSGYATTANYAFSSCKNLTNVTMLDIRASIQFGSGTTYGHLITLESLLGLVAECVDTGASCKLTVGSANITKLAEVYVKLTVAQENDTTGKLPFEQCESTDEGALTITQYLALKNWTIA